MGMKARLGSFTATGQALPVSTQLQVQNISSQALPVSTQVQIQNISSLVKGID